MKVLLDPFPSQTNNDIIATFNIYIGEHRGENNDPVIEDN
jgi:hypothetical protein